MAAGLVAAALASSYWGSETVRQLGSSLSRGLLIFATLLLILSIIEFISTPAGPRKSLQSWLLNLRISILYIVTGALVGTGLANLVTRAVGHYLELGLIDLRFANDANLTAVVGATLLSLVVFDFFFYWYHRCMHKSAFLWQVHKLHHMDEQLTVLSNNRENWLDTFAGIALISVPTAILFKLDAPQVAVVGGISGLIISAYALFFHANIRLPLGRASALLVGPQVHRIHHSRLPQHRDKNFAAFFPLWDVIFGTYFHPSRDEFPPTGVEGEHEVQSLTEAVLLPLQSWRKMFLEYRGRRKSLSV